jgi:LysM repeat protein
MRRYEAYPTIRSRASLPGLPRLVVLAGAIGIAALSLFMLPALLGVGGGGAASPSPSAGRPTAGASVVPTVKPGPTPQIYIVKKGDTMSKIARNFNVTVEEIMAVNPEIKDPNKIALGQQIVIPASTPGAASPAASAKASAKASAAP